MLSSNGLVHNSKSQSITTATRDNRHNLTSSRRNSLHNRSNILCTRQKTQIQTLNIPFTNTIRKHFAILLYFVICNVENINQRNILKLSFEMQQNISKTDIFA